MTPTLIKLAGWLPAVIIPTATIIQLATILKDRSTQGVSWLTWSLFGVANIGLYIYTEKYTAIQSIVGLLGSATLDFVIAALALSNFGPQTEDTTNLS
ncbi:hypothetical protein [Acaryochloris sp. IP29b_bin.137]|uniref:hypothetical protein n=1 Tax=Acaryochloris sp. IP29b_bin.137 TaxID=2969217 RepID=UPI0026046A33|nr:hypothetical protein [Acaryochloris sp. IP29b_bin.137]